jgi:hypothetical protein
MTHEEADATLGDVLGSTRMTRLAIIAELAGISLADTILIAADRYLEFVQAAIEDVNVGLMV